MHSFFSLLAVASIAAAASTTEQGGSPQMPDLSKIPPCALQCLTQAAGTTSCLLTDVYCQCTSGAADIAKAIVPCLCQSTCSETDLMGTLAATGELCITALAAKGESFKIPNVSPDLCKSVGGGAAPPPGGSPPSSQPNQQSPTGPESTQPSPPTGYAPHTNMTPTTGPTGYGGNQTNQTGRPPIQQSTGDASGLQAGRFVGTAAIAGLVGLAVAAL
ncbi:hypothetical protein CB0940_06567 [Cercospora beticola]|uniref:CFEM domain-containing protein n=1 Tax=Cercospora beticola TaxID=122368 RepID=A0A2G5HXA8_CERBT|nr:hypothetical protein CB0940_06567 [Cercospora beticola]PIA97141.1 hypothetical protein CB0940_06567 [Cercospora beticola]WPA99210.1 hypothetical protein RHO25_003826 [Cercospora beticola]CAK1360522.1 unnamed protein product [Cercospora beticola]